MEPHENESHHNSTSSSQGALGNDINRDQLQKRLERFKRRMNRKMDGSASGRTTPASSIGGPPSECGRALSTVSVPAFHYHQNQHKNNNVPSLTENVATNDSETNRTLAARAQLVRTLMQENESLKSTLDKWTPAVSAYRTCHALVQELGKKVEEKDATIAQLNSALKDVDQRGNDSKLKMAEFERRMELKDAALNQLKSKIIELKSQLENAHLAEAEMRRQYQRPGQNTQQQQQSQQQQQQQAAMTMMTMQMQRDLAESMSRLRQRDQELAALTSERDSLVDACTQLQQALQAATSAAVVPISMEMSFKPPPSALCDRQVQTESTEERRSAPPSTAAPTQTDVFSLPNCVSVSVQFTSVDLQPVVIDLPEDYNKPAVAVDLVDSSCQWSDSDCDFNKNDCSVQCEFATLCDAYSQSEEVAECAPILEQSNMSLIEIVPIERVSVSCDTDLLLNEQIEIVTQTDIVEITDTASDPIVQGEQFEMATQTDSVEVTDSANDPVLPPSPLVANCTQTESTTTMEFEVQTTVTETHEEGTSSSVEIANEETQAELCSSTSEVGTDPEHSLFSLNNVITQSDDFPTTAFTDEHCQTDQEIDLISSQPVVVTAEVEAQTASSLVEHVGSDPISFVQNTETQVEAVLTQSADTGTDAEFSIFSKCDASSQCAVQDNGEVKIVTEYSNASCQAIFDVPRLPECPRSPSESIVSVSDCFSSSVNAPTGYPELMQQSPKTPLCVSEIDALRAAVKLLSREKRDLQSRLASQLATRSPRANELSRSLTPLMGGMSSTSPILFVSPASPSSTFNSDGVHSSLSAIQRKITELREQLAAANGRKHNLTPTSST